MGCWMNWTEGSLPKTSSRSPNNARPASSVKMLSSRLSSRSATIWMLLLSQFLVSDTKLSVSRLDRNSRSSLNSLSKFVSSPSRSIRTTISTSPGKTCL